LGLHDNTTSHLINGEWQQMDGSTTPYVYKEEVVTGMSAARPEIIHKL